MLSCRVLGKGKPVVLLHGSLVSRSWGGFDELLSKYFKVYVPELPGFGKSTIIKDKIHNTDLFAGELAKFIENKKLQNSPIIALSLGCVVAAKCIKNLGLKNKLIFVGAPLKIEGWLASLMQKVPYFLRRLLVSTTFGKEILLIPALRENIGKANRKKDQALLKKLTDTHPNSLVDIDYKNEVEIDFRNALKEIKNSVKYIYGQNDKQKKFANINNIKYLEIKNSEHNVFEGNPSSLLKLIKKLI